MPYALVNSQSDKGVEKGTKTEDRNLRQNSNKATNFATLYLAFCGLTSIFSSKNNVSLLRWKQNLRNSKALKSRKGERLPFWPVSAPHAKPQEARNCSWEGL